MPGPLMQKPTLPAWADPAGASVFDVPGQGLLRKVVGLLGLDDPNQVMMLGTAMETGAASGGMLDALAQKFPRTAAVIRAYHGSPHDFEKFETSKIGTGEGAQAYGHGLYFAENPQVAEDYRRSLAAPTSESPAFRLRGEPVAVGTDRWRIAQLLETPKQGETPSAMVTRRIAELEDQAKFAARAYGEDSATMYRLQAKELQAINPSELTFHRPGKTYEVAIKAHPDQFLDWDKPLSEQSPQVRESLERLGVTPKPVVHWEAHQLTQTDIDAGLVPKDYTPGTWISAVRDPAGKVEWHGGQFGSKEAAAKNAQMRNGIDQRSVRDKGHELYRDLGPTSAEAAQQLKQAGIPGIKYLDQGSRAAGEGSRNYVVFDDKTIEILRKYGLLPPVVGATAAASHPGQEQP